MSTEIIRRAVGRKLTTRNQASVSLLMLAWLVWRVEMIERRVADLERPPAVAVDARHSRR